MKLLSVFISLLLCQAQAQSYPSASGTKFNIDGHTGYVAGTNTYWISYAAPADTDAVMSHVAASGLKVLRVWGFNDHSSVPTDGSVWFQALVAGQAPQINTGADGLQRLDAVVAAAQKHGVKLIINFVNNWDDYGGIKAYTTRYGGEHNGWYTNADAQTAYKNYIKTIVSRYQSSSAIFAWELANESRCNGCPTSTIHDWAASTSAYIKSLDGNRMVTLGDEGWNPSAGDGSYPYSTTEGVAFAENLKIATLDFGTFHLYPKSWSQDETNFPVQWIQEHAKVCKAAGKPCLLEEYGVDHDMATIEGAWQKASLNADGMASDLFWQMGDQLAAGQSSHDEYSIYYGSDVWKGVVDAHVADIKNSGK